MRADKTKGADLLFDAIGNIDDSLIQEAQTAPVRKAAQSRRKSFTAIIALAATLTLLLGVFAATLLAKIVGNLHSNLKGDAPDGYDSTTAPEATPSLSQTLIDTESDAIVVANAEDIDFFDGNTRIIWQIEGESDYKVVTLRSQSDAARLVNAIERQNQAISPSNTESTSCDVWITLGDGRVISPYLKTSAGNVGYAELFEYSPEIEPDESLINLINDLISD